MTTAADVDDETFLRGLEAGRIPNRQFRHADHLRAAYLYLRTLGYPRGVDAVENTIRGFAAAHGVPQKFHVTLTIAWARFVAAHCHDACTESFESFIGRNPELLDASLPLRFYSRERLFDEAARHGWREPDLRALPRVEPWHPAGYS